MWSRYTRLRWKKLCFVFSKKRMVLYVRFAINQYSRYPNLITCYCFLTRRQDVTCLFIDIFCWFFSMAFVALKHILHYLTTIRWPEIMIDLRLGLHFFIVLNSKRTWKHITHVWLIFYFIYLCVVLLRLPKQVRKFLSSTYTSSS